MELFEQIRREYAGAGIGAASGSGSNTGFLGGSSRGIGALVGVVIGAPSGAVVGAVLPAPRNCLPRRPCCRLALDDIGLNGVISTLTGACTVVGT